MCIDIECKHECRFMWPLQTWRAPWPGSQTRMAQGPWCGPTVLNCTLTYPEHAVILSMQDALPFVPAKASKERLITILVA